MDAPPARRRTPIVAATASPATEFDIRSKSLAAMEAVFFCADEPLSPRRLASVMESPRVDSPIDLIRKLQRMLDDEGAALEVVEVAGGFQLLTRPEYYPWLARLRQSSGESLLTPVQLETLAIIAYRQPIMRADLEAIRGVHCADALRELMERGLVRIAGRHESLGRPILYGTTKRFLQLFGLRDLGELPADDSSRENARLH